MNKQPVILLEKVTKEYRRGSETVHALRDVTVSINSGDYIAVIGHSGSGKTTMLNIIGCLDHPSSGTVLIDGASIAHADERMLTTLRKSTIGFVFQQFFLIPTLTVLQNVALPSLFTGKDSVQKAEELLVHVGLKERLRHTPSQLSGGEMQRVAIARSLINNPKVLLADEPTGNLDSKNSAIIMELFESLNRQGLTIVMVTHNHDLVKHCSRSIFIDDGTIVKQTEKSRMET
jgi:putative ABC transport system ATP-binding protein